MSLKSQWKLTIGRFQRGMCIWWIHQGSWWQLRCGETRYVLLLPVLKQSFLGVGWGSAVVTQDGHSTDTVLGVLRIRGREKVKDCLVAFRCDVLNLSLTNCWHDLTNVFWTTADIMSQAEILKVTGSWFRKGVWAAVWLWKSLVAMAVSNERNFICRCMNCCLMSRLRGSVSDWELKSIRAVEVKVWTVAVNCFLTFLTGYFVFHCCYRYLGIYVAVYKMGVILPAWQWCFMAKWSSALIL